MENNQTDRVECSATKDPLIRTFAIAALLIGAGVWCWLDSAKYAAPEKWDFKHINEAANYAFNHYLPLIVWPVGVVFLISGSRAAKRKLIADQNGLDCGCSAKIKWENIDSLDATELKSKGWIFLETAGKRIKLDGWKLTNFKALVEIIEKNLPAEKKKI
jgi:hypothetical protein